jgi:hypothetical protein
VEVAIPPTEPAATHSLTDGQAKSVAPNSGDKIGSGGEGGGSVDSDFHACPLPGLVELYQLANPKDQSVYKAKHSDADGHDTAVWIGCSPTALFWTRHAGRAALGRVDVTRRAASSNATHSREDGQEIGPSASAPRAYLSRHEDAPRVGLVDVNSLP